MPGKRTRSLKLPYRLFALIVELELTPSWTKDSQQC
jgi:hypothetical protein